MRSVLRTSRSRLSFLLALVVLATSVMVVPIRAGARSNHCKAPCRHCQTSSAMTCCDTDRSEPSSLPLQTSPPASAPQQWTAVPAFLGATSDVAAAISTAVLFAGPPHGHRAIDLPILNSVFLI